MSSRIFTDLDFGFTKHPITKDVGLKTRENAIIQSVKSLVMTNYNERLFNPSFGSNVNRMLFEPVDPISASIINKEIVNVIKNFEPRVRIDKVTVVPIQSEDGYNVTVKFYVNNSLKPLSVALFLNRLR